MKREGDLVELTPEELSIYLELGRNDVAPSTVIELNAGLLHGIEFWERREASGLSGSRTFITLLRGLLAVDYGRSTTDEGEQS